MVLVAILCAVSVVKAAAVPDVVIQLPNAIVPENSNGLELLKADNGTEKDGKQILEALPIPSIPPEQVALMFPSFNPTPRFVAKTQKLHDAQPNAPGTPAVAAAQPENAEIAETAVEMPAEPETAVEMPTEPETAVEMTTEPEMSAEPSMEPLLASDEPLESQGPGIDERDAPAPIEPIGPIEIPERKPVEEEEEVLSPTEVEQPSPVVEIPSEEPSPEIEMPSEEPSPHMEMPSEEPSEEPLEVIPAPIPTPIPTPCVNHSPSSAPVHIEPPASPSPYPSKSSAPSPSPHPSESSAPSPPPPPPPTTKPAPPPVMPDDGCQVAYDACMFTIGGAEMVPEYDLPATPDIAFTKRIQFRPMEKQKYGRVGVLNSGKFVPQFIMDDGSAKEITEFDLVPTAVKTVSLILPDGMQGSGITHQALEMDKVEALKRRCIKIFFHSYQIEGGNVNLDTKDEKACVVFKTSAK